MSSGMIDVFQRIIISVKGVDFTVEKLGDTWVINAVISKGADAVQCPRSNIHSSIPLVFDLRRH